MGTIAKLVCSVALWYSHGYANGAPPVSTRNACRQTNRSSRVVESDWHSRKYRSSRHCYGRES